jgi:ribose 1,5-bisphosphokinase
VSWVFVVGPSGAGKDSVIERTRRTLGQRSDIVFARRVVTRPAQTGSDHEAMSEFDFHRLRGHGGLAWHWEAHGFGYGVPLRYAHQVAWGRVVVVNGSREHVAGLAPAANIQRVLIGAPGAEVASRLLDRGREPPDAIAARLARNARLARPEADLVIDNANGSLNAAAGVLRRYLEALAQAQKFYAAAG